MLVFSQRAVLSDSYVGRDRGGGREAVGTCRQAGEGAGVCRAVDRVGRVVGADRAVVAEGGAALPVPGSQAAAGSGGLAGDLVRAAHGDRLAAPAARARLRLRLDLLSALG